MNDYSYTRIVNNVIRAITIRLCCIWNLSLLASWKNILHTIHCLKLSELLSLDGKVISIDPSNSVPTSLGSDLSAWKDVINYKCLTD